MTHTIIDFIQRKNAKEEASIERLFQKAHSLDAKLELLLQHKNLQVHDHQLFLAFLAYTEQQPYSAEHIFKAAIQLPKHQFAEQYNMNWASVVKLTATFLTIIKQSSREQFEAFRHSLNNL